MDAEKTFSCSFTPDDPEKIAALLRGAVSVVEIKTESGTEVPDKIIFNGTTYSERKECKRLPDYSGSYVTVHKVMDNGTYDCDFGYFQCSRCGCYIMDNANYYPSCGVEVAA